MAQKPSQKRHIGPEAAFQIGLVFTIAPAYSFAVVL